MRCKSLALTLTVALGGIASAQPGPPPQPPVDTTITSDPGPPEPTPEPQPQPVVQTAPAPQPVMQAQTEAPGDRPDGFAIALGLGYALPTSLETPNITSARIRLSSGFEIEPAVRIANESTSTTVKAPMVDDVESTEKDTTFSLLALGRLTLIQRGRADFNVLASLGFTTDKNNPDGDFNTTTTNSFGLGWGIGVGDWFSPHWQLSMNVLNDLVTYSSTKVQTGDGMSMTNSGTEIGLTFAPQVFMMLHLYN
ncbi:MAG: hypothetical protein HOV81_10120 [Kofleriaceae bacterium]|nr:hypothetical protein [Kofleriaceae bacterium]